MFFPACWDGVNLDSPDHMSHMAYPDGIDNGLCPPSHPIHLVSIFYEVYFSVAPFNALNDGGRFVLANGDPTGYGLHGDFLNGWDRSVLSRAVATCTADSGVIEDCPVFQNEGRFVPDSVMNTCAAKNPLPDENVSLGTISLHLPGCVAVTEGPGTASAADLVPGCVPGGGTGSAAPVSYPNHMTPSSALSPSSVTKPLGAAPSGPAPIPSDAATSKSPTLVPNPYSNIPAASHSLNPFSSSPVKPLPPTTSSVSADYERVPAKQPVPSPTSDYHGQDNGHNGQPVYQGYCHMPPKVSSERVSGGPTHGHHHHHAKRAHWSSRFN